LVTDSAIGSLLLGYSASSVKAVYPQRRELPLRTAFRRGPSRARPQIRDRYRHTTVPILSRQRATGVRSQALPRPAKRRPKSTLLSIEPRRGLCATRNRAVRKYPIINDGAMAHV
jgi:hypothetical protein